MSFYSRSAYVLSFTDTNLAYTVASKQWLISMNNELQVKAMLVHHDSVYQTRSTGLSFYCFALKILELIPWKNPFEELILDTFVYGFALGRGSFVFAIHLWCYTWCCVIHCLADTVIWDWNNLFCYDVTKNTGAYCTDENRKVQYYYNDLDFHY